MNDPMPQPLEYRSPTDEERPVTAAEVLKAAFAIGTGLLLLPGSAFFLVIVVYMLTSDWRRGDGMRVASASVCFLATLWGFYACYRTAGDYLRRRNRARIGLRATKA